MVTILQILLLYISLYFLIIKCQYNCPLKAPIYNTQKGRCVAEYCTTSQFDDGTCIIANSLAKTRWINNISTISTSYDSRVYPSIAVDSAQNLLLETDEVGNKKLFFSLEKNGKGYNNNSQLFYLNNKNNYNFLYNNEFPQSYITTINSHRIYYSFSSGGSFFTYDLDTEIFSEKNLENILGNGILSTHNSIINTPEENVIIYSYLNTENRLVLQKIKLLADGIQIIQTMKEEKKSLAMNSCKCKFIRKSTNFIECLTLDEEKVFTLRLYHSNFTFFKEYKFGEYKASSERAFYSFNEIINLNNNQQFLVMYNDITENGAKPIIILKTFNGNNLININLLEENYILFSNYSYILSDTDNSMTLISSSFFALATMADEGKHLLIIYFNYNRDPAFYFNYFDIYLKDLYNVNYFSRIYTFTFNRYLGLGFVEYNNNKGQYSNSFLIFGYPSVKENIKVNNIFLNYNEDGDVLYSVKLVDNIILENNIFCYHFNQSRILSLPDSNTGFKFGRMNTYGRIYTINKNTEISANDNITISFSGNITTAKQGNYEIEYVQELFEAENLHSYINSFDYTEIYGIDILATVRPDKFIAEKLYGREMKLIFSVIKCYDNCLTCTEESTNESNQFCVLCKPGYYFEENTKNCYKYPKVGYYLKKDLNVLAKCYDLCLTCDQSKEGDKSHCLSCKANYLLYPSTNCLSCKSNGIYADYDQIKCIDNIPKGYFLNDSRYNTIDKCHENCGGCSKAPQGDNMNCDYCDNLDNYFLIENTKNCLQYPHEGYYLASNNKFRPCHPFCKNCSAGPTSSSMNCDYCNKELGYFRENPASKNCKYQDKEKMYYSEEEGEYLPCYKDCLFCFDKEQNLVDDEGNNYLNMNCLSCNKSDNFIYFTKTAKNCLNCKSQNKYVNSAKTFCIDNIPDGYYLINSETNELEQCYSLCKSCHEKGVSEKNMKCDSCYSDRNYFLLDGNCVLSMTCPNFFYYKKFFNDTFLDEEKNCLSGKEDCPQSLSFYLKNSFECINSCTFENILDNKCYITNLEAGLNNIFAMIYDKYLNKSIEFFEDYFAYVYNDKYNLVIKIKFFDFEGKTETKNIILDENLKRIDYWGNLNIGKNFVFEEKGINLEQCLEDLNIKNFNNVNDTTKLIMIKIDIKNINLNITRTYFKLYLDNDKKEKIDLSSCSSNYANDKIFVININDIIYNKTGIYPNISNINQESENDTVQIKIYDNDKCTVTYDENDADIIYEDRIALFNQQFINNVGNDITIFSDTGGTTNIPSIIYIYEICPENYKLINFNYSTLNATCINIFNFQDMINDINITKLFESNTYMNKNYIDLIEKNPYGDYSLINSKLSTEPKSDLNIKYMKCINNISKQFKKNYVLIILTVIDIIYLLIIIIYFSCYRKYLLQPKNKSDSIGKIGLKDSYYYPYKLDKYQQKVKETKGYKKDMFSSLNSDILSINNNNINNNIHNRNKSIHNFKHNKIVTISEEVTNRQNYYKTEKNNDVNYIRKINLDLDEKGDYDLSEFLLASIKDRRSFCELFLSITQKKQILILALKRDDNFIKLLRFSLLPFCIINYFTTNVFFFNDKVIHQIFLDEGSYNFSYQLKIICLSALLSSIFLYLAKLIFIVKKNDFNISRIIKIVDYAFIIIFILFVFYWIYVGSYTSVFIKSQKHICYNFLLTIVACIIYEIILTIISICLRKIAINNKSPNLYKFSIILILLKA